MCETTSGYGDRSSGSGEAAAQSNSGKNKYIFKQSRYALYDINMCISTCF